MHERTRRGRSRVGLPLIIVAGLAGAFVSGAAWAADAKLDEANAEAAKAVALLKGAQPSSVAELEAHRKKAIDLITRAQGEILKAKAE